MGKVLDIQNVIIDILKDDNDGTIKLMEKLEDCEKLKKKLLPHIINQDNQLKENLELLKKCKNKFG